MRGWPKEEQHSQRMTLLLLLLMLLLLEWERELPGPQLRRAWVLVGPRAVCECGWPWM